MSLGLEQLEDGFSVPSGDDYSPSESRGVTWSDEDSGLNFDSSTYDWVRPKVLQTFSRFITPESMDEILRHVVFTDGHDGRMVVAPCHSSEPVCRGQWETSKKTSFSSISQFCASSHAPCCPTFALLLRSSTQMDGPLCELLKFCAHIIGSDQLVACSFTFFNQKKTTNKELGGYL